MNLKYLFIASRVGAFIIDHIPFYILVYSLSNYGVGGYIAALLFLFLYRYITTVYFGATPGMMILKLKLKNYGFKICLKREIYRFASALFWIGYLVGLIEPNNRTLHDIMSGTYVVYNEKMDTKETRKKYIIIISNILLVLSILRWCSFFILNDIGFIGLKKVYYSDEYYQNFDGDNLSSLSQEELYMKTLGRKYTTMIDINKKPTLIRISNKLTYIEVYRLLIKDNRILGDYLYKIDMPIQFICSGNFRGKNEMCGLSPKNDLVLIDEKGTLYGQGKVSLGSVLTLMCGDIDSDNQDEAVILGRGGGVEVFKLNGDKLDRIYKGKIGEDIIPQAFYISQGIVVFGKAHEKSMVYSYDFKENTFLFKDKKYIEAKNVSYASKLDGSFIISHVYRNSMTFGIGNIQLLEAYDTDRSEKKKYNFGLRPGRRYGYMVRTLEGVCDIDGDGSEELIIKAVGKSDVMGQGYVVEIYKPQKGMLLVNRVLTIIEDILY
jgi:uncharacterized RDD family membrane protein YckC